MAAVMKSSLRMAATTRVSAPALLMLDLPSLTSQPQLRLDAAQQRMIPEPLALCMRMLQPSVQQAAGSGWSPTHTHNPHAFLMPHLCRAPAWCHALPLSGTAQTAQSSWVSAATSAHQRLFRCSTNGKEHVSLVELKIRQHRLQRLAPTASNL